VDLKKYYHILNAVGSGNLKSATVQSVHLTHIQLAHFFWQKLWTHCNWLKAVIIYLSTKKVAVRDLTNCHFLYSLLYDGVMFLKTEANIQVHSSTCASG